MKTPFLNRLTMIVTKRSFDAVRFALAVALTATLFIGSAYADTYSLTTRVKPNEAGAGGLPSGKTYCDLTSSDTVNVTAANAQLYFTGVNSATLNCNIVISGDGYGSEKTGKFRMQMAANGPININGTVNLTGEAKIGSHNWSSNQGILYFNNILTGNGGLTVAPGYLSKVHLANTSSVNNYKGNTQIGSSGMYNNSGVTTYAGTLVLDADEQIPDVLTAGSTSTGALVMYSWADGSNRLTSTLDLNGHTETINGLVCTDALSVIKGSYGSKLRVGADNSSSTFTGKIQDGMQLEKIGTGTLTLSGENTHSGGTTISEGTLVMNSETALGTGTITFNDASTLKVNIPNPEIQNYVAINSGAVGTIDSNGQDVTISGYISGEGGLTKTGAGTLTLNNISISGNTVVSGGKLFIPSSSYVQTPNITVNTNGTFQIGSRDPGMDISETDVAVAGGTLIIGEANNSAEVYLKSLSLNGGTIHFDINDSTGYYDSDWLTFTESVSLQSGVIDLSFNYADEVAWWNKAASDPIQLMTTEQGGTIGEISDMRITVSGFPTASWTLTTDSTNVFLSPTDVPPGEAPFWFANTDDVYEDWVISGSENNKYGIKLIAGGDNSVSYSKSVSVNVDSSVEVAENYELTIDGQVSGTGAVDKIGAGTLILSQAPSYTGNTTISTGTLKLSAGGTLYNLAGSGNLDNSGKAVTINNTDNSEFSGVITGAGALTKAGNGTLTLSGANDYTGGTTISAGTLKVTGEGALGTGAVNNSGILEFAPGEEETMSIGYTISNNGSAKTVKSGAGTLTTSNWINNNVDLQEGTLQITGGFGNGKRFNGQITIAQGATLLCATHDSLGYGSSTTKMYIYGTMDNTAGNETLNNTELHMYGGTAKSSSGGTYDVLNTGVKFYSYALDGATASNPTVSTISAPIRLRTDGTFEITTAENSQLNLTGVISRYSGNCTVTKLGEGTLYITATNSFTNPFTIKEGLVITNSPNAQVGSFGTGVVTIESGATMETHAHNPFGWGSPNDLIIRGTLIPSTYTHITNVTLEGGVIEEEYAFNSGATGLDFGARTGTITSTGDSIIKSRIHINNTATATFDVQSDTLTVSGEIKSTGGFTKTGEGTMKLTAANTYSGNTTVSGGTLLLTSTGSLASPNVTVNENGTFQTGANIASTNVVLNGGSFIIGETAASANLTAASLTMTDGAVYFDFNGYTAAANDYDLLTTNSATLASGIVNLTFNSGDETSWWNNSTDSGYVLINSSSIGIDLDSVQLLVNSAATDNWYLTTADNNLVLMKLDGPEPPVTDPYYYANTADISADKWTIDGVNKKGVKFLEGDSAATYANPVELNMNGLFDIAANHDLTVTGAISGAGALNKKGEGTLTLSNNGSSFTGNLVIDDGVVIATAGWNGGNKTSVLGKLQSGRSVVVNEGGELRFASHDVLTNGENSSLVPITVNGGRISNAGAFFNNLSNVTLKNGASIYAEDGHATYKAFKLSDNVYVTRNDDDSAANPVLISGNPNNPNAAIAFNVNTTRLNVADVTRNAGAATDDLPDLIISTPITDAYNMNKYEAASVEKLGEGTATFSGANTYTGLTYVSAGTLNITGSSFKSRLIVRNGGTAVIDAGDGTVNMNADGYNNSLMIGNGSNGTLVIDSGNVTVRNSGNNSGSVQLGTNGNCTGVLTINGGAMQVDGRILLSANNDNAKGTLNMNGGTLTLGVPGGYTTGGDPACGVLWFGQGTTTVNLNGGTIALYGIKQNNPNAASSFNFNGGTLQAVADNNTDFFPAAGNMKYYVKQGGAIFDTNGYNVTVSARIEQGTEEGDAAGGFTKKGEGTLTMSQAPAYTGSTTVEQGTMALAAGGTLNNLSGGKLNNDDTVAVAATLDASGQALTLNNSETSKFVGSIKANTIEKTGEGTLKIRAESPSSVTADRFAVSAGELDFRGDYNGDLFVANGATLSPGNSIGDMTVYGNVTMDVGATGLFEFSAYNAADPEYDTLTIANNGAFVIDENSIIKLYFENNDASLWAAEGAQYKLVSDDGFASGTIDLSDLLANFNELFGLEGRTDGLYLIGLGAGPIPPGPEPGSGVPEPSTWALLILGAMGLLYMRKRK